MLNITVIGMMGEGKTSFVRKYIKGKRHLIFDVNNEYRELGTDNSKPFSRVIDLDYKKFIELSLNKRNTCIVYEDATGFLEGRLNDKLRKALVSKRHTGNINIFLFHSISSVPPRLIQLSDYVVLFKTKDEDYQVMNKYPSLYNTYSQLKTMPKHSYKIIS